MGIISRRAIYILGGFFGSSFGTQLLFIGILAGAGIGLAYVAPIAVGIKWFPDKKGMITGLAVAGFGFGATIWVKLADSWFGGLLNTTRVIDIAGIAGPQLAGAFRDAAGVGSVPMFWMAPFLIAAGMCLFGALLLVLSRPSQTTYVAPAV